MTNICNKGSAFAIKSQVCDLFEVAKMRSMINNRVDISCLFDHMLTEMRQLQAVGTITEFQLLELSRPPRIRLTIWTDRTTSVGWEHLMSNACDQTY